MACSSVGHFNYVSSSGRSKQRLTLIEYDAEQRIFKALQLRNASEAKMGIRRKDGHYFFPEEAIWMVEAGLAAVLHQGLPLSVQQCYSLLGKFLVTPAKFLVYSYLKRAGYVIFPHNALQTSMHRTESTKWKQSPKSYFPPDLLNRFPTLTTMKKLTMTPFPHNPKLEEVFGIPENFSKLCTKSIELDEQDEARRSSREYLRPRYWPRFDQFVSHVPTWAEYRTQKANILKRNSTDVPDLPHLPIDYDVYAGDGSFCRSLSPKPLYRLLVVDATLLFPSVSSLHWLSSRILEGKLLIAVVQHGAIVFYNIDHQAVCL